MLKTGVIIVLIDMSNSYLLELEDGLDHSNGYIGHYLLLLHSIDNNIFYFNPMMSDSVQQMEKSEF
jgi:hypothetical protein